jgi:hypothetical protein
MSTELNLTTLNWTTIECRSCRTITEVLAADMELERPIHCRNCGHDLRTNSETESELEQDAVAVDSFAVDSDVVEKSSDTPPSSQDDDLERDSRLADADASGDVDWEYEDSYEEDSYGEEYGDKDEYELEDSETVADYDPFDDLEIDPEELEFTEPQKRNLPKSTGANHHSRWSRIKQSLENRRDNFAGAIVSIVVHGVVLLILALIVVQLQGNDGNEIIVSMVDTALVNQQSAIDNARVDVIDIDAFPTKHTDPESISVASLVNGGSTSSSESADFVMPSREAVSRKAAGDAKWAIGSGTGFEGRSAKNRAKLAAANGGTPESEAAVEMGLAWLAQHQLADGSWSFSESTRIEGCTCGNHGRFDARTGATGMALLAFMGAGYTHHEGQYKDVVQKGLTWLTAQSDRGDFRFSKEEAPRLARSKFYIPAMYCHGLATIALCEAYGMTDDRMILKPARQALDFIARTQHTGGGWRYSPNTAGDTSVVGWQVMAIVSGRMSGLHVSREVPGRIVSFLDSVHESGRGTYGYADKYKVTPATMAIGTLCRMYVHFGFQPAEMQASIKRVALTSPTRNNAYANYYVMQVLHHWGGHAAINQTDKDSKEPNAKQIAEKQKRQKLWHDWNVRCRDRLVKTQIKAGHSKGSWKPFGEFSNHGGTLYQTALSVMTLEVYYRHMPVYGKDAIF